MKTTSLLVGIVSLSMLSGCATIVGKSGPEALNIRSNPDQAIVAVYDEAGTKVFEGKTPTMVSLPKKKGFFSGKKYTVKISKSGYAEQSIPVKTKLNGWYFGNIVFGGPIGLFIVDPATGAMWTLDTQDLNPTLSIQQADSEANERMKVVLLENVPQTLRSKMVKVPQ